MNRSVTLRFLLSGFAAALLAAPADADILYRFREGVLFDGKHGPIAKAQASANAALIACGKPGTITADGKFGRGTRDALVSLAQCPAVAPKLTADADVAFYIDGAGDALGSGERSAWQARGRLRASDAGLTDARPSATFTPEPPIDTGIADPASLTDAERAACPRAVLDTRRP